jgi:hypothetical protein
MENPWEQERIIKEASEIAKHNGFRLENHRNYFGKVSLVAEKSPYTKDTVIASFDNWRDLIVFMSGYEAHEFERGNTK